MRAMLISHYDEMHEAQRRHKPTPPCWR